VSAPLRLWVLALLLGGGLLAAQPAQAAGGRKGAVQYVGRINLNEASAAQLDALPGVGQKAAAKIVAYRDKRRFARIEELVKVKGFGKKRFLLLKPHLTLEGPTTFRVERPGAGGAHGASR
jgi:competence protein ComEA